MTRFAAMFVVGLLLIASPSSAQQPRAPTSELDTFMQQVLARRDDNWKKVQQYIFDEQERAEFRGPGEMLLWGEKREYLWYPRDGFFVRSPVRFNGVTIGERDREKYEQDFLRRARKREERAKEKSSGIDHRCPAGADRRSGLYSADARPAVHLVGLLSAVQIRRRSICPCRPRDDRQPPGTQNRVLPDQVVLRRTGDESRGTGKSGDRAEVERGRLRGRSAAADEQGLARDALGRTGSETDREIHVR